MFKSQEDFNELKRQHKTKNGLRPEITARGIKLMERGDFDSNIRAKVKSMAVMPVSQMKSFAITGAPFHGPVSPAAKLSIRDLLNKLNRLELDVFGRTYSFTGDEWSLSTIKRHNRRLTRIQQLEASVFDRK